MSDELARLECGATAESMDEVEEAEAVTEAEEGEPGSLDRDESHDRFRCAGCRKPLGVSRPRSEVGGRRVLSVARGECISK